MFTAGFTDTFTSRYIDTGELRLHEVEVEVESDEEDAVTTAESATKALTDDK